MNDWTAETANGYEAMLQAEENFINRITAQFNKLTPGTKIFFYNNRFRRNEWATVRTVNPTTAHIGFVTTTCGKQIWAEEIKIAHFETETETFQICLRSRVAEILSAAKRAEANKMDVFADFESDNYVVVNRDNKSEYRVVLKPRGQGIFASCECKDFTNRNRVCKHITEVLRQWFAPLFDEIRNGQIKPFAASCEFGNFKRQHYSKSGYFATLDEAKDFVREQIGNLQGIGSVVCDGQTVWEYCSDVTCVF